LVEGEQIMGVAVLKVSREMIDTALPILQAFGGLISVNYPQRWGDPCEVRFVSRAVPDEGEHRVKATFTHNVEGATATTSVTISVIAD
jgi:hypothetical protein